MQVANLRCDLYQFGEHFCFDKIDLQVTNQYIDRYNYDIIVKRLDSDQGWQQNVQVMSFFPNLDTKPSQEQVIITVGPSDKSEKTMRIETKCKIFPSNKRETALFPRYNMQKNIVFHNILRETFNDQFSTDIVVLPSNLFAVGIQDECVFIYNEDMWKSFDNIKEPIIHIARVIMEYKLYRKCHFIICADDGYLEKHFLKLRNEPRLIQEYEYCGKHAITMENDQEYAVLYDQKWVLAQSSHKEMPWCINIIDRHYFYHNLYNPFRSFHRGIQFHQKADVIVVGISLHNTSKTNFLVPHSSGMTHREYFYSDFISKNCMHCPNNGVNRNEMIYYKYILDVDGNSATWDATAWKLNSGSVIFKVSGCWSQWFYRDYHAWVHYIPIANDYSDIQEKFNWCQNHPKECMKIVKNAMNLFQKIYRYNNVIDETKKLIENKFLEMV